MTHSIVLLIIFLSVLGIGGLALFLFLIFRRIPDRELDKDLEEAGYDYDPKQNIFYSRIDAWQRDFGYCKLYDDAAVPLGMIFDCEPIHFEYGGKRWLIEFWKGQYGMTTGGEIGVYTAIIEGSENPDDILYKCADDDDMLPMAFVLKKNNRVLFRRSAVQWWLTGFELGEFSEPSDLSMDIAITLKDKDMMQAFALKLIDTGYSANEIKVLGNAVILTFSKPCSDQPRLHAKLISRFSQWRNKLFCKEFQVITGDSHNIYDATDILKKKSPTLYARVLRMGKPDKLFSKLK
jgi:hypothetical protein